MTTHRLIIDPPTSGALNMALDEALLSDAAENGSTTLRFYQWCEPTLSLGYFQSYDDRRLHTASIECACVRRQTGGGAILHDRELTYSLTLPASHPLARRTEELYRLVHEAFIAVLAPLLVAHDPQWQLRRHDQDSSNAPSPCPLPEGEGVEIAFDTSAREEPFLCFQRRARGDVVLAPVYEGPSDAAASRRLAQPQLNWKILGSAQRRHRGAVLQHGSVLLGTSAAAPEVTGLAELTGVNLSAEQLCRAAADRIAAELRVSFVGSTYPAELESVAAHLANTKYAQGTWTNRR